MLEIALRFFVSYRIWIEKISLQTSRQLWLISHGSTCINNIKSNLTNVVHIELEGLMIKNLKGKNVIKKFVF